MKVDLVLQGTLDNYAREIAEHYKELPWVESIIISCWKDDPQIIAGDKIVRSLPLSNNGIGNRNAQITTSHKGLMQVKTDFAAKLRSDQKISLDSMNIMYEFMLKHEDKICVMGMYKPFPFHPRDHSFWGKTKELVSLFDIPLDNSKHHISNPHDSWPNPGFYSLNTRAECHIASQYLAKKDSRVRNMVNWQSMYLHDFSPRWQEAKDLSDELMPKYFIPFPRISFEWPKHGLTSYPYESCANSYGEFWTET
jgi:hypothetical protein